ncbi:MAG: PAS/PAC sensor hybrid histidine kinase [Actinobacteria bacterium]|nr:PAS/PAC sensor hybrid histidine kinase [Actinomycetota bacterium]MBM2827575.1 sensor hybrid histidine kinase [Actinomycetota bacterium]
MKHQIEDLLDIPRLQAALDSLYASSKIPSAIIDNEGKIHTGSGWQDVCTKFHRVHPEARKRCIESDIYITGHIGEANPSITYKCPHGLVDSATPIFIEGEHIGNVFTGQLFLEEPDLDYFRSQGSAYGFDEEKYIDAVKKVPVITGQALQENLAFVAHLTGMLAEMGLKRAREKEAEKRFRESEERYRAVVEGLPDVVMRFDRDGRHLFVSDNVSRVVDLPAAQFIGKTHRELGFPEAQFRFWEDAILGVFDSGAPYETEFTLEGRQGPVIFNWRLVPERDAQGMVQSVLSFKRDITDHRRAEEKLRQSEKKILESQNLLQAVVDGTTDAVYVKDLQGRYRLFNAAASRFTGKSFAEVIGNDDTILFPADEARTVMEGDRGVIASGKTLTYEEHVTTAEGEKVTFLSTKGPMVDEHGNATGLFGIARDITGQKRAEESIRESEAKYRGLFEHMQEGCAYCRMIFENGDPMDFIYLSVNTAFETLTGLKDVAGKRVSEVIPGIRSSDPALFETYGRVARTGEPEKVEIFVEALQQWFLISVYSPEQEYFVAVFDVITDRKRAEVQKEKLQAQLLQAMKMEAVGRLAGGVAHDFNNLLTVIIGNVALALMKLTPSDPAKGLLDEANKAAERATRLTQQLLAFSRKQIIEPKVQDINILMVDLNKMLIRLIGENIDLKTIPGEDLWLVKVDAGQFEQILVNLAVNARDAMPDGGKVVIETSNAELDDDYCSRHPYVKPGRFVVVAVSDTGHGMSEEVKEHIFEPFFTTKAKGSGTGFGLATTYGAVKQAGGSIEVYSEVGMGTTFKIYLPRIEGETSKLERDDRPKKLLGGTETVLLVEDENIVRELAVRVLDELGYRVLQAGNGDTAIALAMKYGERIDLLLTDVVMPGMSGREVANRLTQIHPETRVLFTSGYTDDAIVHHGVLDEGVSFIGKPYTPSALARKVREVLGKA